VVDTTKTFSVLNLVMKCVSNHAGGSADNILQMTAAPLSLYLGYTDRCGDNVKK